jgi:dipeptidyl aminopeptidase/acylaminoacyl peptidase
MNIHFCTNVRLPRRKAIFFLVLILQLVACSLWGQVLQKKMLTVADYPRWGTLRLNKLNADGKWTAYTLSYENGRDTLFVKNTKSLKTFAFPSGNREDFITPDWFACQTPAGLNLVHLKTGKQETISNAAQYLFSPIANRLLILVTEKGKENTLVIRELDGNIENKIVGIDEFISDPGKQLILYTSTKNNLHTISLLELSGEKRKKDLLKSLSAFSNLIWHQGGKALAFIQNSIDKAGSDNSLFYYSLSTKKLYGSNREDLKKNFLGDSLCIADTSFKLKISDDLQKVFFAVQQKAKSNASLNSDVQLWNANAKWIYPMEEKRKKGKRTNLALWHPMEDRYQLISNDTLPQFMLTGDQHYALLSNTQQYEPQYKNEGNRDFYLKDLATGKNNLILKDHSGHFEHTIPSPGGKYIAYFKDENWWIYDIANKTHTNITQNIPTSFANDEKQYQHKTTYPDLGWTLLDKEILLCDAYDIWAITPDGASARRLTHGRETQTRFRLAGYTFRIITKANYSGRIHDPVELNQGLLLETTNNNGHFSYYKWHPESIKELVFSSDSRLDQIIESAKGNAIVYTEERYHLSPRLMMRNQGEKKSKIIFQSNPHQQQFYWGKSELIAYKNSKGETLQGLLYYPSQYDSQKKYPMIVYIYEKFSQELNHKYFNPSQYSGDAGFNISAFTTQGYFVLAPDISYELGNPGLSAVDCVVAATEKVISKGLVLPDKIGLTGHSFGGYETDFIITQTSLFAAALAGSAATDMTSSYLTIGWNTGQPDMWRFENKQMRMSKSLFEDKEAYDRNSPILHSKNMSTPLLSWTGNEDRQVNWNQSIEFYLALRRLEKKHILLIYPDEGHTLSNGKNQKDLSIRFHEWFDYHLKDTAPAEWIKTGLK